MNATQNAASETGEQREHVPALPRYHADQFRAPAIECDVIMKGGITSGIVYPYAVLEIATRYRFRSLGGTSAGAIAAAFAAAAEYARTVHGDHDGFVRLQRYCDELPDILPTLFQADPEFAGAVRIVKRFMAWKKWRWILNLAVGTLPFGGLGYAIGWMSAPATSAPSLTILPWVVAGLLSGLATLVWLTLVQPILAAKKRLVENNFGACSGLTVKGSKAKGLTDWLHEALQDIAFGDPKHADVLTFGHLEKPPPGTPPILLRMVTTNVSMSRPHVLPALGMPAGYMPDQWQELFPASVMTHLKKTAVPWAGRKGSRSVPTNNAMPVICAVRMSLSFPLLFKAIPILTADHEFCSVVKELGGGVHKRISTVWLSDGGLSSNFPIHLFDAPLPSRPTFAISLDTLQVAPSLVKRRVMLPRTSQQASKIQVTEISSLKGFGWGVIGAAKDWQDQLASEISGQRERIARVFLDGDEGGLDLAMPPQVSRSLMSYGLEAGRLFNTQFDFDEHRWRRLLSAYRNTGEWVDKAAATWSGGYNNWFRKYRKQVKSYKKVTMTDRELITTQMDHLATTLGKRKLIYQADRKLPGSTGVLRVTGRY